MKPLPMPIRIAAGLVVTALEEVQELPRKLSELPVTAVSQALQVSMRLQQRVTELAIKGDRALGALRPVPEAPAWARFDEDFEQDAAQPPRNGLNPGLRGFDPPSPPKVSPVRLLPSPDEFGAEPESEVPSPRPPAERPRLTPAATTLDPADAKAAAEAPEPDAPEADATDTDAPETDAPETDAPETEAHEAAPAGADAGKPDTVRADATGTDDSARADSPSAAGNDGVPAAGSGEPDTGPPGLRDYETWSLPQLRGRFRALSLEQLHQLLEWETTHQDRPPYVTMLSNRIASVTGR